MSRGCQFIHSFKKDDPRRAGRSRVGLLRGGEGQVFFVVFARCVSFFGAVEVVLDFVIDSINNIDINIYNKYYTFLFTCFIILRVIIDS